MQYYFINTDFLDRPRTSVLTEVHVILKLKKKIKATVYLITHTVNTMPVSIRYTGISTVTV